MTEPPFNQRRPAFIQWKGTDVCMDLHCPACHYDNHYDGYFAYVVKCAKCGALWEMSWYVQFRPYEPAKSSFERFNFLEDSSGYDPECDPEVGEFHNCSPECGEGSYWTPEGPTE